MDAEDRADLSIYPVGMPRTQLLSPPKARPGEQIAVLSPSFAAPAVAPRLHEQALRRLEQVSGLVPVEYPTTRELGASPGDRARDLMAAFTDPRIRAVIAAIGGDDQITVIPHLDAQAVASDPKPFLGYSDNTHLHHFLHGCGVRSFYGGSTQIHLGPGPGIDECHAVSLRAALLEGGEVEIIDPGVSQDHGLEWGDPESLHSYGEREETQEWTWAGPAIEVRGATWGGCLEVVSDILAAGRFGMSPADLEGGILLVELSEEVIPPLQMFRMLRTLGERGVLGSVAGVAFARPPVSDFSSRPDPATRQDMRRQRYEKLIDTVQAYNPDAVICCGIPFGHTRPQWIVPCGGTMTLDGKSHRVFADYS